MVFALALLCAAALVSAPAAAAGSGKGSKAAKGSAVAKGSKGSKGSGSGGACPAQHEVNAEKDKSLGCTFAVPAGYAPATAAEFDKQTKDTTPAQYQASARNHTAAVPGAGNGGIRCPKFFKTTKETTIYRLFDSRPGKAGKYGGYWTFKDDPHGSGPEKDAYRKHYAICTDWNNLDSHVACKLKKGVVVQAGPGESVHKWKGSGHPKGSGPAGAECQSVCSGEKKGIDESYKAEAKVQVVLWNADQFCDK
jgi:hypothetical protein